jgi:hypothetical protein
MPLPQSPASTAKIPAFNPDATVAASSHGGFSTAGHRAADPGTGDRNHSARRRVFTDSTLARAADAVPADIIADAPIAERRSARRRSSRRDRSADAIHPAPPAPPEPEKAVEQEIDFGQSEKARETGRRT